MPVSWNGKHLPAPPDGLGEGPGLGLRMRLWNEGFTQGFGLSAIKRHYELIPLVVTVSLPVAFAAFHCMRILRDAPDVRVVRSRGPPHEEVGPREVRMKYYVPKPQKYAPIPELEAVKNDVKHDACD